MPKNTNKTKKKSTAKGKIRANKNTVKNSQNIWAEQKIGEFGSSYQFPDYHIKYLSREHGNSSLNDCSNLLKTSTSDKSTECYFKDFGDFWPYLGRLKLPELIKDQRFCFMLNHPQFLRKENRIYLENLQRRTEAAIQKHMKVIEKPKAIKPRDLEREKEEVYELEFQEGEEMMKKDFPNYFQYLKSYYIKKRMCSLGNKDNKDFKEAIVNSSRQSKEYLGEMDKIFGLYLNNFVP